MKYEFQGLLSRTKEDKITGPMSPVLFMQGAAKQAGFKFNGLVRVINPNSESGYDHLIARAKFKSGTKFYYMFCDMGHAGLPMAMFEGNDLIIPPIYKKEITPAKLKYHRDQCEIGFKDDTPIMVLNEDEFKDLFTQAELSGEFKVK